MLTTEQVELRRSGLGGTDVAAIFGEGSRRRAIDVWREKTGDVDPFPGNKRTRWGEILEPVVAREYAAATGLVLARPRPLTIRHPGREWHLGSPDRLVLGPTANGDGSDEHWIDWSPLLPLVAGAEIKTHGLRAGMAYGVRWGAQDEDPSAIPDAVVLDDEDDDVADPIPPTVRIQVAWYMALLGVPRYFLVALIDSHLPRVWEIPRDLAFESDLLDGAERFWRRNVLERRPPDPDGSASFARHLKRSYLSHDDVVLPPSELAEKWAPKYAEARAAAKAAERELDVAKQHLQAEIGAHRGIQTSAGTVTWAEQRTGKYRDRELRDYLFDRAGATPAERANILDEFSTGTMRVLRVPGSTK